MKTLLTFTLALLISVSALSQTKLRYWDVNNPRGKHTVELKKTEYPYYRLALDQDGGVIGRKLYKLLQKDIWPDVPFSIYLPVYTDPSFHYETELVVEYAEDSSYYVIKEVQHKVWDVSPAMVAGMKALFKAKLMEYLVIVQQVKYPDIPDGPNIRWELYYPDESPRYRWQATEVIPGLYTNQKVWQVTDKDLWDTWVYYILSFDNPLKAMTNRIQR